MKLEECTNDISFHIQRLSFGVKNLEDEDLFFVVICVPLPIYQHLSLATVVRVVNDINLPAIIFSP